jgi:dolichyl-phosphate beta-glucosyltransferase
MDISIIIPAFDESGKIARDVELAASFLQRSALSGEIIVVDDGSKDDTAQIASTAAMDMPQNISFSVLRNETNRGKGYAVRHGIKHSRGDYVVFVDCGGCVPYEYINNGLELLQSGDYDIDIAHASRKHSQTKIDRPHTWHRRLYSRIFRSLIAVMMKIDVEFTDTQCGFKMYKGIVARKLYAECVTDGFMFDVEIILLAKKHGYRIMEFPIKWTCDRDSRLTVSKNGLEIFKELIAIKKNLR